MSDFVGLTVAPVLNNLVLLPLGERNCWGCNGAVTHQQFEAVREGLHPETGEFLRPRHSADRLTTDGEVE